MDTETLKNLENLENLDFFNNDGDLNIISKERTVFLGKVQSGKTKNIISRSIYLKLKGYNVLIICNSLADCEQLNERFKKIFKENKMKMKKHVINISGQNFHKLKENTNNFVFIINAQHSKLKKIAELNIPSLFVIIDECDLFGNPISRNGSSKEQNYIKQIIEKSIGNSGYTATAYSLTHGTDYFPLLAKNLHFLNPSSNYVGFNHERCKKIETNNFYFTYKFTNEQKKDFLNLIKTEYETAKNLEQIPITLINITHLTKCHDYLRKIIMKNNENNTVLISNKSKVKYYHGDSYREFKSIQKALGKIHQKIEKHDHIFIITGIQLGRGISPRSEVSFFKSTKQIVYACSIIYACSNSKPIDEIKQALYRICGNFPDIDDKFQLRFYTTKKILEDVERQEKHDEEIMKLIEKYKESKEPKEPKESKEVCELIPLEKGGEEPPRKVTSDTRNKIPKPVKTKEGFALTESTIKKNEKLFDKRITTEKMSVYKYCVQILNKHEKLSAKEVYEEFRKNKWFDEKKDDLLHHEIAHELGYKKNNFKKDKSSTPIKYSN